MRISIMGPLAALGALILGVRAQYYALPPAASSPYTLSSTFDQSNFFNEFQFFTGEDPTHGFVEYVDGETAKEAGLADIRKGAVYMGVDSHTPNPSKGRRSVRLTSSQAWTHGLFIADIEHMPGNVCGVWPAFWMFGADWPTQGEIDIIEGISWQATNQITLHTDPGCYISNNGTVSTTRLINPSCNALERNNEGCGQKDSNPLSYGDGFNAISGGVYATEWTSSFIAVWFFPRFSIPSDITRGAPNPSTWGPPTARFNGGQSCNIDQYFQSNNLVFDTTFCGDWAGGAFAGDTLCSSRAASCEDFVGANPGEFSEAYWLVNSIKVYNARTGYSSRRHIHRSKRS